MTPPYLEVSYHELDWHSPSEARQFWWHCLKQFINALGYVKVGQNVIIMYKSDFDKLVKNQKE